MAERAFDRGPNGGGLDRIDRFGLLSTLLLDGDKFLKMTDDVQRLESQMSQVRIILCVLTGGVYFGIFVALILYCRSRNQPRRAAMNSTATERGTSRRFRPNTTTDAYGTPFGKTPLNGQVGENSAGGSPFPNGGIGHPGLSKQELPMRPSRLGTRTRFSDDVLDDMNSQRSASAMARHGRGAASAAANSNNNPNTANGDDLLNMNTTTNTTNTCCNTPLVASEAHNDLRPSASDAASYTATTPSGNMQSASTVVDLADPTVGAAALLTTFSKEAQIVDAASPSSAARFPARRTLSRRQKTLDAINAN